VTISPSPLAELTADDYAETAAAIEEQIGRVIVGQHDLVRAVLVCLLCEGHALLEGVPGLGKTMLLKTLSDVVDLEFSRIQFTPDLMPADIVGTQVLEEGDDGHRRFRFRPGPVFASLVLADEINRATPKTQSALLEAMQERRVTVAGETRNLPRPFLVMATQNPLEMEGTYPLPEAQLDRFLLKALVPFPSADELATVIDRTTGQETADVERVADADRLAAMIDLTRQVPIAEHLTRHAVDLVLATHPDHESAPDVVRRYVRFGASPRGAQSTVLAAKAAALLDGRPNVAADDLRAMAPAALRHRLVLGYEATADGVAADSLVDAVLEAVPPPTAGLRGSP
jgi:MoxR-like ATPase